MDRESIKSSQANGLANRKIDITFSLKLVNNDYASKSIEHNFDATFPIDGGEGWGEDKVIENRNITRRTGFLTQDECVIIECRLILNGTYVNL